uniref:NADH dehydrogenase subunit 3 n=1 Tax=Ashinkailepas seepiophila TaxID=479252 RepID=UPI0021CCC6ED|nr:NADH dehydrogenase subunit 3 [Ashinkailepas seepiophila]UWM12888.1 NADH dehydrogenase subunit 3 [Ashinkailepas seepiophila]
MKMLFLSLILATFISMMLILISSILSKKLSFNREKPSPFECGFDPKNTSRIPFSIRFFLIAIIFLIFDIEISVLLPLGLAPNSISLLTWIKIGGSFLFLITLGLYYEWKESTLEWIS